MPPSDEDVIAATGPGRDPEFNEPATEALEREIGDGSGVAGAASARRGHPSGLWVLFITEMWERFSYYGMRALLVLYLTSKITAENPGLGFTQEAAGKLYGWYTALVYLTPVFGGLLADKLLGTHRSVLIGGWIIAAGHFTLALTELAGHGPAGVATFMAGLVLIIVGTGFFKPCVSVMVGQLYAEDDPRRDSAFTIFYMGINVGAFLAGFVAGTLGETVGWHWGFGSAGVGMVIGLLIYQYLRPRYLKGIGLPPRRTEDDAPEQATEVVCRNCGLPVGSARAGVGGTGGGAACVQCGQIERDRLTPTQLFRRPLSRVDWHRMGVIVILAFFVIFFWAAFEQAGSSMNLFAYEQTDRTVAGYEFPATWYQSVNPLYIILFAPVFAWLWVWLDRRGLQPRTPVKFALGLMLLGFGFIFMVIASLQTAPTPVYHFTAAAPTDPASQAIYLDAASGQFTTTPPAEARATTPEDQPTIPPALAAFLQSRLTEDGGAKIRKLAGRLDPETGVATCTFEKRAGQEWIPAEATFDLLPLAREKLESLAAEGAITDLQVDETAAGAPRYTARIPRGDGAIALEGRLAWAPVLLDAALASAAALPPKPVLTAIALNLDGPDALYSATFTPKGSAALTAPVSGLLADANLLTSDAPRRLKNLAAIDGLSDIALTTRGGRLGFSGVLERDGDQVQVGGDSLQAVILERVSSRPDFNEAVALADGKISGIAEVELLRIPGRKAAPYWLLCAYLLHTLGELCLSPVGLSMVTKLAAPKIRSLMMGVWFLSNFASNLAAGYLFAYSSQIAESRYFALLLGEADFYLVLVIAPLAAGLVVLLISPILNRMMHGLH